MIDIVICTFKRLDKQITFNRIPNNVVKWFVSNSMVRDSRIISIPFGVGKALTAKKNNQSWHTFVLLSDGEMQEGSNWEAIMYAGHHKLSNLILFIDVNNLSQVGIVDDCCTLEPITNKFESFNFNMIRDFKFIEELLSFNNNYIPDDDH